MGRPPTDPNVLVALLFLVGEFIVAAIHTCPCTLISSDLLTWESGSRILNGERANIEDYPFYGLIINSRKMYLDIENQTSINVHCGSSLISPSYFLTAFHCFMNNRNPKSWMIIMGLKDRCKTLGSAKIYRIAKVIPHPQVVIAYKIKKNDIAIIKVDRPVLGVKPISLPTSPPAPGDYGEVIGFGLIRIDNPNGNLKDLPCPLQKVSQKVPNQLICKKPKEDILGAFCVVDADKKNAAACRGDSGGPWITKQNGNLTITGVSSFGDSLCKVTLHSDHYTNVFSYLPWIHDVIKGRRRRHKGGKKTRPNGKTKRKKHKPRKTTSESQRLEPLYYEYIDNMQ